MQSRHNEAPVIQIEYSTRRSVNMDFALDVSQFICLSVRRLQERIRQSENTARSCLYPALVYAITVVNPTYM
jgi:hypothetical protein